MTLPWMPVPPVEYRHRELALYRAWEVREHKLTTQPSQLVFGLAEKYSYLWRFFFGISLSATLLFTSEILRARRMRVLWLAGGLVGLLVVTEQSGYPHYLSPAAPVVVLFLIQGLRRLAHWRWHGAAFGPVLVRSLMFIWCLIIGLRSGLLAPWQPPAAAPNYVSWCCTDARQHDREPLQRHLEAESGKQLVIVQNALSSYDTFEWVYNEPSIDQAKIVWASDMGTQGNLELLRYFQGRHVWRVLITDKGWALADTRPARDTSGPSAPMPPASRYSGN